MCLNSLILFGGKICHVKCWKVFYTKSVTDDSAECCFWIPKTDKRTSRVQNVVVHVRVYLFLLKQVAKQSCSQVVSSLDVTKQRAEGDLENFAQYVAQFLHQSLFLCDEGNVRCTCVCMCVCWGGVMSPGITL